MTTLSLMKNLFVATLAAGLLLACDSHSQTNQAQSTSPAKQEITISGKVKSPQPGYVVLAELQQNGFQPKDSVQVGKNNAYTIKATIDEPAFYSLTFFDKQRVLLILDGNNLEVNADGSSPTGAVATKGSKEVENLEKVTRIQNEMQAEIASLEGKFQAANVKKDEQAKKNLQTQYMGMQSKYSGKFKQSIQEIGPSLAAWYATNFLNPADEYSFLDSLSKGFEQKLPNSRYTKEFAAKLAPFKNMIRVGQPAPEITLNNPEGKPVSLSSLRGKYVLIDFWASWCGPCRQENPNVVKMYDRFKDKKFEIFGVSLDQSKDKWVSAIEKDKLSWVHVSDLKFWQSAAAQAYGVQAIPATFLVDPEGKVIAKNLRGGALEDKLAQLFNTSE